MVLFKEKFLIRLLTRRAPFYVTGLQMNLYAMDVRTPGIYRFGIVDKVSLPASAKELPTYEAVHVMLRSLEVVVHLLPCYHCISHHAYQI